jgi:hypothetical protein
MATGLNYTQLKKRMADNYLPYTTAINAEPPRYEEARTIANDTLSSLNDWLIRNGTDPKYTQGVELSGDISQIIVLLNSTIWHVENNKASETYQSDLDNYERRLSERLAIITGYF